MMKWIRATDLERWAADRLDSRTLLAAMVGDLIRASSPNRSAFRFPNGDKGQLRGFDGDLEIDSPVEYVPSGSSKWEFGVSDGLGKAESDYKKKTASTPKEIRQANTLILVTPRSWDSPRETLAAWLGKKREAGEWQDVRYIDGVQLEHWLDDHPAVSAHYARKVLRISPDHGTRSTEEFWTDYLRRYDPNLTEAVALAGREEGARDFLRRLSGESGAITIGAESEEDVALFAVCAIRTATDDERLFLEARTLVVETVEAVTELANSKGLIFIVLGAAAPRSGTLAAIGPAVVAVTGVNRARQVRQLARPSASAMAERLESMGYERQAGYSLAVRCGRSLTVLQRLIPNGFARDAAWAEDAQQLKFALLAGGWSSKSALDIEAIKELAGTSDYDMFEVVLRKAQLLADPPVDNVADVWQVRSPVDAFPYYGHLITSGEFERLRAVAAKVFSHSPARPSASEKFQLDYVAPADYSNWLRRGLATTLNLIAVLPATGNLQLPYNRWQEYVDELVGDIPGFSRGHLLELANRDEFGLLAEAAPESFIRAVEKTISGSDAQIRLLFAESEEMFAEESPHLGLLFAIERLAWSSQYLTRLGIVLARLAEVDPGGRYSNRPIETLRVLLLPWSPQTYAPLAQRIACLDAILTNYPDVGWRLLVKLLPSRGSMSPTQKPHVRDFSLAEPEVLTYAVVWEANSAIAVRAAKAATGNVERVTVLVKNLGHAAPKDRLVFLKVIEAHLAMQKNTDTDPVWQELREEAMRHSYFCSTDWAMKDDELRQVLSLVEAYTPKDRVAVLKFLFDDWTPHIGTYGKGDDEHQVEEQRLAAIRELWNDGGTTAILKLVRLSKQPHLIVAPLVSSGLSQSDLLSLLEGCINEPQDFLQIARSLSLAGDNKFKSSWRTEVVTLINRLNIAPQTAAELVNGWAPSEELWALVSSLGTDVEEAYWRSVTSIPEGAEKVKAVERLISIGRGADTMRLVASNLADVPSEMIVTVLQAALLQPATLGNMLGHLVSRVLKELRTRSDLSVDVIAKMEFAYLAVLDSDREELLLHQLLRSSPKMYVEVVSEVFRAEGQEPRALSETERGRSTNCYELLTSMKQVPGQTGVAVDEQLLSPWVNEVRRLAKEAGRLRVADVQMGELLAKSPASENGNWPQDAVANVIEHAASKNLERGIVTGLINLRGVFSKGLHEGGRQERELAAKYDKWADGSARYPRTASMLRSVAKSWVVDATNEDVRAEKSKLLG